MARHLVSARLFLKSPRAPYHDGPFRMYPVEYDTPPLESVIGGQSRPTPENDGVQSIASRLWSHSAQNQMLRHKCSVYRKRAREREASDRANVFRFVPQSRRKPL